MQKVRENLCYQYSKKTERTLSKHSTFIEKNLHSEQIEVTA